MSGTVGMPASTSTVWHPRDASEACRLKKRFGSGAVYTAGGTLLRTQWEAGQRPEPAHLIDLSGIPEMRGIRTEGGELAIGALTTLAVCRRDPYLQARFPLLAEAARAIAAPSIRNLATIGGNILSAVGDSLPVFLVYKARLIWREGEAERAEDAEDWLERGGEETEASVRLLLQIRLPLDDSPEKAGRTFGFYGKIGRREAFVPSLVTTALTGRIAPDGQLRGVRLAAGDGKTVPRRFPLTESRLEGAAADDGAVRLLHRLLLEQYKPAPDPFATAEYRKLTAANLAASHLWQAIRENAGRGEG
ncbi:FAD binding domain-containing protein [Cohnella sp. REN36]|uniref:FAD binding domain-containing protein n=1 Tax=Cohnella sp. REN36 TaxID=2887347 RepID=UPI001D150C23|nr:FAD binding domain-containing protein [Cohnella sp. REN36]MCC3372678.1 FAD binding domain-containing protein [Cohnella sp. REN36]